MTEDDHYGRSFEPFDDRDEEDPEYTIDPMFSGTHADGGEHRKLRHKSLEDTIQTPADKAIFTPKDAPEEIQG